MRRRLWWQILALDVRASEDRGSAPILADSHFNTVMPCNLDDDDFKYDSQHPLNSRTWPTEMTLSLLMIDALTTGSKINFRPPAGVPETSTLQEKENLVKEFAQRVEVVFRFTL